MYTARGRLCCNIRGNRSGAEYVEIDGEKGMSLQVWLPLTKDLRNQGLSNVTVTNNGATFNSAGKLGGCYTFTNQTIVVTPSTDLKNSFSSAASLACWVKVSTSHAAYAQCMTFGTVSTAWAAIYFGIDIGSNGVPIGNVANGSNSTNCSFSTAIKDGKWHHLALTYESGTIKSYMDGVLKNTVSTSYIPAWANATVFSIGGNSSEVFKNGDAMNDVRLYNHCLSPMEIKELSKGLVLHYPLNRGGWGQENLVWNSNWNLHSTNPPENWINWGSPPTREIVTIDGKNWLHVISDTTNFQGYSQNWTKRNGVGELSAGQKVTVSFTAYLTTAATIAPIGIHWNNSSGTIVSQNWTTVALTTSPKRYYFTYTTPSDCVAFNIMVGDNTNTAHEIWITDIKLEEGSIATPWCPNSSDALATTMGLNSITEYDCSGYCNNGIYSALPTVSSNTPKYNVSTYFGAYNTPHVDMLDSNLLSSLTKGSVAWWEYCTTTGNTLLFTGQSGSYYIGAGSTTTRLYDSHIGESGITLYKDGVVQSTTQGTTVYHPNVFHTQNQWHHFVITGVNLSEWTMFKINSYGSGWPLNAYISDVRIYATALSADDVKSLYQNSAYIDSSGNVYGAVHEEG